MTERQRTILNVIRTSVNDRGYPPSIREIGDAVGLTSTSSVAHQLRTLERKGYLRRDPNRPRAVDVRGADDTVTAAPVTDVAGSDALPEPTFVPVLGRIAAGGPILAEEAVEDVFPLPRELVGQGTLFLLKVVGESMVEAAICDGDWVVVRQQNVADNGDIVAAMIDGEATVKTFKRAGGQIWLMPHNPPLIRSPAMTRPCSARWSRLSARYSGTRGANHHGQCGPLVGLDETVGLRGRFGGEPDLGKGVVVQRTARRVVQAEAGAGLDGISLRRLVRVVVERHVDRRSRPALGQLRRPLGHGLAEHAR
ncbi:repressor LexA [Mycobacterium ulcerans str. Harvey]|uniref:LexA repressor n=1 Tax=Mycobacterium ulcerans str. Harvey TaxID=1299332 RepID=A0ABP3AA00_MYCUL|nr:repressor LexA [Mycobacterium ulcerans str. Harvey]